MLVQLSDIKLATRSFRALQALVKVHSEGSSKFQVIAYKLNVSGLALLQ